MAKSEERVNMMLEGYGSCYCSFPPYPYTEPRTGDELCPECGFVYREHSIDYKNVGWRAFDWKETEKKAHAESRSEFHHTLNYIGKRDGQGKPLKQKDKSKFKRIRKWGSYSGNRTYQKGIPEISRICSQLELNDEIKDESMIWYKFSVFNHLIRGRSMLGAVAASIRLTCKINGDPTALSYIIKIAGANGKDVYKIYKELEEEAKKREIRVEPYKPQDYVNKFCSELQLPTEFKSKLNDLIEYAEKRNITSGRDPRGIVGAGIYLLLKIKSKGKKPKRTQKEIAKVAKVTEVTIRSRYKEMAKALKIEI